jgi:hypothetical protein
LVQASVDQVCAEIDDVVSVAAHGDEPISDHLGQHEHVAVLAPQLGGAWPLPHGNLAVASLKEQVDQVLTVSSDRVARFGPDVQDRQNVTRSYPYSYHIALDGNGINGLEGMSGVCLFLYDPEDNAYAYKVKYFSGAAAGHWVGVSPEGGYGFQ